MPHLPVRVPARLSAPPAALASLAALIRNRLHSGLAGGVTSTVHGLARWGRGAQNPATHGLSSPAPPDSVIVAAAAQFAPNSYARARLLRQMHACGLLTEAETEQAEQLLGVAN